MIRDDFSDLSDIQQWNLKSTDVGLGTVRSLENVRLGQLSSHWYRSRLKTCLAATHKLTDILLQQKEQISTNPYVTHADLECVDSRYLLCGFNDGGVAIYDTFDRKKEYEFSEVSIVKGGQRGSHKYQVDCVQWFPADAGLFVTSSHDKKVKIWNPNYMKPVDQFSIDCDVLHHHMSPVATKHSLLSVSAENGEVILYDMRNGSSSHRLQGHDGPVQITQWSPRNEHILMSGGRDHTVRMWDVRASRAYLMALDMEIVPETSKFKKKSRNVPKAHNGRVTSLCFTHDGAWLLSFGYDGVLRLWDSATGKNMNVKYEGAHTDLERTIRMAVSHCTYPDLIFVPCKSKILVFEVLSGRLVNVLLGHYLSVLGVVHNPVSMDLYSIGSDYNFVIWVPKKLLRRNVSKEEEEDTVTINNAPVGTRATQRRTLQATQDTWSSDDD